jgi:hypothetical protein
MYTVRSAGCIDDEGDGLIDGEDPDSGKQCLSGQPDG